ncbi:response regulator receiver modulated metal dependent phosphohydrolase [Candidatus Magnetobacterium bavaricum]|uniref:Response regulator receiver modulated metal dependent phosphohydrolase n=1 Tax=Candidatus Magnetobacterium bavaricum TaxID=29290 RepID=A0A0F3GYK8_9BACT|nr:response regulator receiver modulated metal dependent phosphohydrolase [Candidatus Magnetobacterium bavaricum]
MIETQTLQDFVRRSKTIRILYVEDDRQISEETKKFLLRFFEAVECAANGQEGLDKYRPGAFDIVISDIRMPHVNGIEMVRGIKKLNKHQKVIVISAHDEANYLMELINLGVNSFLLKPLDVQQLLEVLSEMVDYLWFSRLEQTYKKMLENTVDKKTVELKETKIAIKNLTDELLQRLISAAEHKDSDTGEHIARMGLYSKRLARELGVSQEFIEAIGFASPLHDIGKIGIPDNVLLKQGGLTAEEFEIIKTHSMIGASILSGSSHGNIQMAESIALCHHERWDGSGYPAGLRGESIPLEARIVIICDQYDALVMKRPYKPPFEHKKAVEIITKGDGRTLPTHFDPDVLAAFSKIAADFNTIYNENKD